MPIKLNGSTSGYTQLSAPATAGNNTLTLPTGNGTAGQALTTDGSGNLAWANLMTATGPAFAAYMSSNQTVSNTTQTKLTFNTKLFDTAGCFDNATNYRFTPTVAGYYVFASVSAPGAGSGVLFLNLYKNGSQVWILGSGPNTSPSTVACGGSSGAIYMNGTTDYVEVYAYQSSGGNLTYFGGITISNFSGYLVRPA